MTPLLPFTVWDAPWLAPCALALDLLLGDPALPWPHPVCLPGRLMHKMEPWARSFINLGRNEAQKKHRGFLAGLFSLLLLLAGIAAATRLLLSIPHLAWLFALYLAWAGLAMGCLLRSGKSVLAKIENAPLPEARLACSWLVSRDVSEMNQTTLRKTLADTLSENFTDAFTAPFFWLLCTGPVGLWLYKTVSTMDSQWGYLCPKWKYLGYCGAKGDDLLAWLPARISVVLLLFTDKLIEIFPNVKNWQGSFPSFQTLARQARGMPSPNSGWSMCACAWLCAGHMAGPSIYFGELVEKPWLGPDSETRLAWDSVKLLALCKLMFYGTIIGGLSLWAFVWFAGSSLAWLVYII